LDFQNAQADNLKSDDFTRLYYKKIVLPSTEEENKHKEYLEKNLKKNYFN